MKPLLKWAGGKARLASQINDAFKVPCRGTYYEPFLGAGAVFFHRRAEGTVGRAVLSDVNARLMEVHRVIRDDVEGLLSALDELPGEDWRERYYGVRERYNEEPQRGRAHAARFMWLNRAGYNGLYRENRRGRFNVPVGSYKKLSLPKREAFLGISELLQGVELVSAGFESVMSEAGDDDQVYCDPPYVPLSSTASFTGYCAGGFGHAEQKLLAVAAQKAALRGARVVLSNHDLPEVRNELYPECNGFAFVGRPRVRRSISRNASKREKVCELIASIGPLLEQVA